VRLFPYPSLFRSLASDAALSAVAGGRQALLAVRMEHGVR
jgi:hypothetical protein